jgi:apolipoprotein D and lipocalin family protein
MREFRRMGSNRTSVTMRAAALACALLAAGCQTVPELPPLEPVDHVDLARFMGKWYVIANIPTFLEKGAHNATETYELRDDGTIATTFTFRKDAFDGALKTLTPTGHVGDDPSNAVWGMQFVWPVKAQYLIIHLDDDYSQTVIGRDKRDYVWIMAREPRLSASDYDRLVLRLGEQGYDVSRIERVPQRWD